MRSKAPLMMIEQMVMLLVFALAAVLCLQAFTLSQNISQQNVYRDRLVIEAQNAAEAMKSGHGDTYFKEMEAHIDDRGRESGKFGQSDFGRPCTCWHRNGPADGQAAGPRLVRG